MTLPNPQKPVPALAASSSACLPGPASPMALFIAFTWLALQGFGGVLAVVQRELVEKKRWLTPAEFIEDWAVAQILPGPNVVNLSLMIGGRYFGLHGALAALSGMLALPLVIVLTLAFGYAQFAELSAVAGALRGMAAVAAGLIMAAGLKMLPACLASEHLGRRLVRGAGRCLLCGGGAAALAAGLGVAGFGWRCLPAGLAETGESVTLLAAVQTLAVQQPIPIFGWQAWLQFFLHFLSLSLLSVGGALTTAPEMHRFLVDRQGWLSHSQFNASIALAQAAPGPNILFVALIGWNIGVNAGGWYLGLAAALLAMLGILLPSTLLTYNAARWGHRNRALRPVRAFKQGMAPVVVALLLATGWILASSSSSAEFGPSWKLWALSLAATLVVWRSKIHLLWLLAAGALLGGMGWV